MYQSFRTDTENVMTVPVPFSDPRWELPIRKGWLTKQGRKGLKRWKKRFFILTHDGKLWYFINDKTPEPRKKTPLFVADMKYWLSEKKKNCLKIERYPTPLFLYADRDGDRIEWMEALKEAGCIRCESEMKQLNFLKNLPEIAKKDVSKWSSKNVVEWMKYHSFGVDQSFEIYAENLGNVAGKDLVVLEEKDLRDKGIAKLVHRKKLMRAIREITTRRTFNYSEFLVYKKIEAMVSNVGKSVEGNWKFLAKSLSDPETMQETYLNPSVAEDTLASYIDGGAKEEEEDESEGETDLLDFDDDDVEEESVNLREKKEALTLPVKLVVTEMVRSDKSKTARKILSPVLSRIPSLSKEFGIFHTALIIGPWYLEWTDSSLCIPRKLYSGMALVSADVEASLTLRNMTIQEICERLARCICIWNTTMVYKNMSSGKKNQGNCQEFVEDIMQNLGLHLQKEGAFGRFLENMKNKGTCELEFMPSKQFKSHFKLSMERYRFDTHAELDEFMLHLAKIDEIAVRIDYREEMKLLKSFDRAFWLRHFKKPEEPRFKPSSVKCPFDDPRKTKSYMVYK